MITVITSGNIGRDAELKTINGKNYASFSVASTRKNADGTRTTTWVRCMKYDGEGRLTPWLKKGTAVALQGTITLGAYIDKEGAPKADLTLWVNEMDLLGGPREGYSSNQQQSATAPDERVKKSIELIEKAYADEPSQQYSDGDFIF